MNKLTIIFLVFIIVLITISNTFLNDVINIINNNIFILKQYASENEYVVEVIFFTGYILAASLSLPVALALGLFAGIIFDTIIAVALVSFASSIGATFAFMLSRYFFRDIVLSRYKSQYKVINEGFMKYGAQYLFSLRMAPIFPFFIINFLSGLTSIGIKKFYIVSQVGMLPMTVVIIMIGNELSKIMIDQVSINLEILVLISLIGLLPLVSKLIFNYFLDIDEQK